MLRGPTGHRDARISHERLSPKDDPRHLRLIARVGKGGTAGPLGDHTKRRYGDF